MKTSLLDGYNDNDQKELKGMFIASLRLRRAYEKLIDKKVASTSVERLKKGYEEPSWAFHQADLNGYERALNELKSLLND